MFGVRVSGEESRRTYGNWQQQHTAGSAVEGLAGRDCHFCYLETQAQPPQAASDASQESAASPLSSSFPCLQGRAGRELGLEQTIRQRTRRPPGALECPSACGLPLWNGGLPVPACRGCRERWRPDLDPLQDEPEAPGVSQREHLAPVATLDSRFEPTVGSSTRESRPAAAGKSISRGYPLAAGFQNRYGPHVAAGLPPHFPFSRCMAR
jgi:hypothetical protein